MQRMRFLCLQIYPGVFTTLAWDNIDRLEETLSGDGTFHRINGIAVQPQVAGPMNVLPAVKKSNKRSISPAPTMLPTCNVGKQAGPSKTATLGVDTKSELEGSSIKNHVWFLAQMSDPENQVISSWTGFNIQVCDNITVCQDTVSYLSTISDSCDRHVNCE